MVALNLGWNPSARCLSYGFEMHLSRPAISVPLSDREAVLWFGASEADDVVTIEDIFERRPDMLNEADRYLDDCFALCY
ncbi:hypothetical protein DICVIV_11912 [Dictyocaulus viviparus]|uniref:Uncharacterized protein n=1 Tax=Dictyocaulus viviparus TaxID=29172 RepID=A0A0D8XBY5_DICVI|nr:hypothetical protein DICVIV_11912 [Dictyocaulus viviparus]